LPDPGRLRVPAGDGLATHPSVRQCTQSRRADRQLGATWPVGSDTLLLAVAGVFDWAYTSQTAMAGASRRALSVAVSRSARVV
jgi:hypothetical protein